MGTQKGGRLSGGAATEEVLDSSRGVLAPNQFGRLKGLQQFYTPVPVATWIARVTGRKAPTLDLTAGDGALLAPMEPSCRFGVEIDGDQIRNATQQVRSYQAIHGDVQQIYPMLHKLGARFRVVVLNPPFGLPWDVPGLDRGGSAELTLRMGRSLLDGDGMGVVICGADRFERELRPLLGEALFAVVRVDELFPGTKLPCSIAFWREGKIQEWRRERAPPILELALARADELTSGLAAEITGVGDGRFSYWGDGARTAWYGTGMDLGSIWAAVQEEHNKRRAGKRGPEGLALAGGKVRVHLTAYNTLSVVADDRERLDWMKGFNGQPPSYFALRPKEWLELRRLCAQHSVHMSGPLVAAVDAVMADTRQVTCPLYPVALAQRLAFLTELDEITCKVGDAERGYAAGVTYPLSTKTEVHRAQESRTRQTTEGPEAYEVLVERKALQIQVGEHTYDEGTEAMTYLLEHFAVPDPGDLSSQFPQEVAHWIKLLRRVEQEIQEREPGFRFRTFQVRDMARLLVKIARKLGGVLAWEMGLGKALAQGAMVRALELDGRLWDGCALFTMPQDLVPQFTAEMKRFFGVDLIPISRGAMAVAHKEACPASKVSGRDVVCTCGGASRRSEHTAAEVIELVRARRAAARGCRTVEQRDRLAVPKVWAVTWFEALAIAGRESEGLPPVRVAPYRHCLQEERPARQGYDYRLGRYTEIEPAQAAEYEWRWISSALLCPRCGADRTGGWDGTICRAHMRGEGTIRAGMRARAGYARAVENDGPVVCGYVHRRVLRKPAYAMLAPIFKFVSVDEGTKIQGDTSLTSRAIRAFTPGRAPFRVLCTGTPMKNYVHQMFWLLWWALGDSTPRFPYAYRGGSEKFLQDFGVTETVCTAWGRKERGAQPKILPEVSNLLYLWKMLCGAVVRRRMDEVGSVVALDGSWTCRRCGAAYKADVGDPWTKPAFLECYEGCGEVSDAIVPLIYRPVDVPWGADQKRHYQHWLSKDTFAAWFLSTHPDSPLAEKPEAVKLLAASIGQLAKLEDATVDPTRDLHWTGASAWTPSRMKVLQIIEESVRKGHRVLYGSCLVAPGRWVADRLKERGINAVHLTELDTDGKARTKAPRERARAVMDFRAGKAQVLCTSVHAMSYGHNLDVASVVVVEGLPWDFAGWDQFVKRARRLTSKRPVEVYPIIPTGSLTTRKWDLLRLKTDSADLALDGRITGRVEAQIDRAKVLQELIDRGVSFDGSEVPEEQVHRAWLRAGEP